jgi:hypothetical protein
VTIGAMFVWVFFENLGKGLYTPAGYAGLINYYIKASHCPAAWKTVMGLAANHAAITAPMQGLTEISLGILLVIGLLTRPAGIVRSSGRDRVLVIMAKAPRPGEVKTRLASRLSPAAVAAFGGLLQRE